jgi:hypothetical protein
MLFPGQNEREREDRKNDVSLSDQSNLNGQQTISCGALMRECTTALITAEGRNFRNYNSFHPKKYPRSEQFDTNSTFLTYINALAINYSRNMRMKHIAEHDERKKVFH